MHNIKMFVLSLTLLLSLACGIICPQVLAKETATEPVVLNLSVMFATTDTLDPTDATSPGAMILFFHLYDSLLRTTSEGCEYSLAESVTPNETADEWTVVIRKDAKFTDGREVTGQDVLDSLAYIAEAPQYGSLYGNLDTEGSKAEGKAVVLKLKESTSDFAISVLGMMSPVAPEGKFEGIGAGPFKIVDGDVQRGFKLEANPDYIKGKPGIDELNLLQIPDPSAQLRALQTGEIDLAWSLDPASIKSLENDENIEIPEPTLDSAVVKTLVLNTRVEPFNDAELRQAAKLTLDREKMVKVLLGDYGVIGNDMLGKGYTRYPENIAQTEVDKAKAKKIFDKKGVNSFKIVTSEIIPGMTAAAELMQQEFAEIGVKVEIEVIDPMNFFSELEKLYASPAFTFYWINRDPMTEFSSQVVDTSPYNSSGYSSEEIMKNYRKAKASADAELQQECIDIIQKEIHENGGDLVWGYQLQISAYKKGLEGVTIFQSVPWLGEASFEPAK